MSAIGFRDPFEVDDEEVEVEQGRSVVADVPSASGVETWFGRALLAIALLAALICDLRLVQDAPNYFPDNEANRVAMVQYIADHGTPPVLGTDSFIVDPIAAVQPNTTVIHAFVQGQSPTIAANAPYPQVMALQPPYPYYLAVPVTWIVPWNHRVLAFRLLSVLLACAGIGFLWAAVRVAWPANPVAAGLAAIVLATMSGLTESFSMFQPASLLFVAWCAGMWLVLRDLRQRRCSWWTVAAVTLATSANVVALPAAVAAVIVLSRGAERRYRQLAIRIAAVLAPTVLWVMWNLHAYQDPWPLNVTAAAGVDRPRNWHALTTFIAPMSSVSVWLFDAFYASGSSPFRHGDQRPESLVAILFVIALAWALWSGGIASARLALARFGTLMAGSFASIYAISFLASVFAVAAMDYSEFIFGGYAAAWAGVAGIGLTTPLAGHRRCMLVGVSLVTVALVWIMLRAPNL